MRKQRLVCLATIVVFVISATLGGSSALAHPPWDPYDATVFAPIKDFGPRVKVVPVATGLTSPLKAVAAPGHPNKLFIVDQVGKLWMLDLTTLLKTVVLDVSALLVDLGVVTGPGCPGPSFDERGLLGVAFHPRFPKNGKIYTYTSEPTNGPPTLPSTIPAGSSPDHQNVLSEWIANNPANPTAGFNPNRRVLMRVDWPQFNHDGGDLGFGPDGNLYISMGDGGGADDRDGQLFIVPGTCGGEAPIIGHGLDGNGQKLTIPLGKILRIDVDRRSGGSEYAIPRDNPFVNRPGAVGEIWAFGFRNPFRFSFDTQTGDLHVGDVGQNDIEEVNLVVRGGNYGWRIREGTKCFDPNGNDVGFAFDCPPNPAMIDPIAQYDTHHEGHSVIGGFVYRGTALGGLGLEGRFIFGEFAAVFNFPSGPHDYGRLLHTASGAGPLRPISEFQIQGTNGLRLAVLGMGQDAAGEIYVGGNVSGLPFGTEGLLLRLAVPDDDP